MCSRLQVESSPRPGPAKSVGLESGQKFRPKSRCKSSKPSSGADPSIGLSSSLGPGPSQSLDPS